MQSYRRIGFTEAEEIVLTYVCMHLHACRHSLHADEHLNTHLKTRARNTIDMHKNNFLYVYIYIYMYTHIYMQHSAAEVSSIILGCSKEIDSARAINPKVPRHCRVLGPQGKSGPGFWGCLF